jgi:hypothetical protein
MVRVIDVLRKLEATLDHDEAFGRAPGRSNVLGVFRDPFGCLSPLASDVSFVGSWYVVRDELDADGYPWLVQDVAQGGYRYQLADGLVTVMWFFHANGTFVNIHKMERLGSDPDLWWINSGSPPGERGVSFFHKVYATIIDFDDSLNKRSIECGLGRKASYQPEDAKRWELVFTDGRFWLRKQRDQGARFLLKDPRGGSRDPVDIRKLGFPRLVRDFQFTDHTDYFNLEIKLENNDTQEIGGWYAEK